MTVADDFKDEQALRLNDFAAAVNDGSWLKAKFPDKDWHRHARGRSGDTQWCDGTPSDCATKARV